MAGLHRGHTTLLGGGMSSRNFVVLLAGLMCIVNTYLYVVPWSRRHAAQSQQETEALRLSIEQVSSAVGADAGVGQQEDGRLEMLRAKPQEDAEPSSGGQKDGRTKRDKSKKKNVLFIMTDDLRPSLSIYDKPVVTPAFERLAKMSTVFERAYNQDPICNPSRNSMLSGRRPDTTRVWLFEHTVPHEYSNIFKYFKEEGKYLVYGAGKLWHWTNTWMEDFHNQYWPGSTEEWNHLSDENYALMNASVQPDAVWPEERFFDYRIASEGVNLLEQAAAQDRPWFLGIGFHQPHRPWHMPQKYWDLYDDFQVPITPHTTWPVGTSLVASGDINPVEIKVLPHGKTTYWANPEGGVGMEAIQENVRGYHASISFIDHQLERLLDKLDELGQTQDTIIVFCVDHGMNIGDHGMWDKRTLFETNARVPLIIRDPDVSASHGLTAPALVENVDIFPTLIEMAGLPDPGPKLFPPLEGKSLLPILQDPMNGKVKDFAMTQIARCCSNGCSDVDIDKVEWHKWEVCKGGNWEWNELNERTFMGYSIRTDDWRYTIWVPWNTTKFSPEWEKPLAAEELYDHRDPRCNQKGNFDLCEDRNVAKEPSVASVKEELFAKLRTIADTYNLNAWEAQKENQEKLERQSEGPREEVPLQEKAPKEGRAR